MNNSPIALNSLVALFETPPVGFDAEEAVAVGSSSRD
jgi:hypothetical protein